MPETTFERRTPGGCADIAKVHSLEFSCCTSCHEDANEFGFEYLEEETPAGFFMVCCAASRAYERATLPPPVPPKEEKDANE